MNTMINLIKLHYTSILAMKKSILIILALAAFVSISNVDGTMIPFSAGLIIMMLNYNTLAYEDKSKSNFLIYSLPVKPQQYILSKYIFGVLNILIAMFFGDLVFNIFKVMNMMGSNSTALAEVNFTVFIVGIFTVAVVIPIALIAGFNKARIILIFLALLPVCFSDKILKAVSYIDLPNLSDSTFTFIVVALGIILIIISYFITSNLYAKKDIN